VLCWSGVILAEIKFLSVMFRCLENFSKTTKSAAAAGGCVTLFTTKVLEVL
jgi:hypothetical protein